MGSCLSMSYMIVEIFKSKKVIHDNEIILEKKNIDNELFVLCKTQESKFT